MNYEQDTFIEIIKSTAQECGINPHLAIAIAGHETNYDPLKVRYEPTWRYLALPRVHSKNLGISYETEVVLQSMSWGCMQVMGSVARELGFSDHLTRLVNPELGINFGCKKLKQLYNNYLDEASVIAAYNAGTPKKGLDGNFINQAYVNDVLTRLTQLRAL